MRPEIRRILEEVTKNNGDIIFSDLDCQGCEASWSSRRHASDCLFTRARALLNDESPAEAMITPPR